ncbi:MAG: DMT family transporter [Deltaproteobacteria bacterium]|nr:DMT family transporter [Deltaproteobacteria bacterium]
MSVTRNRCIFFAIMSSTLSSVATLFKVQGVEHVAPLLGASVGVLFAGLISFPYLAFRRQLPTFSQLWAVRSPLIKLIIARPIISNILFTVGLTMKTGVKAVFLTKMEPYLVIFWVWVLDGKRPSGRHLNLLLVHILGAILLSVGDFTTISSAQWGDAIIFTAVITAGLSYRYAPRVTAVLTPTQTAAVTETAGGLLTLPIALAMCSVALGPEQREGWMYLAVHSVLFYVLAVPLLYASLGGIEGWHSSALRATGPLTAVPIAYFFFGERLSSVQLLGGLVVLTTSALVSRPARKRAEDAEPAPA